VASDEKLVKELDSIKRLLILLLVKLGSDSDEISMALNVDSSAIRKMISMRQVSTARIGSVAD
jgi:hypothetical protein